MMSGGRKAVQGGVRVKLPAGVSWDMLASMAAEEVRQRGLLPPGFMPLPHIKQALDLGQVAEKKGESKAISDFGRQMVADHGKTNQQLAELARAVKVPQPKEADEQHKAMLQYLDKLGGSDFDLAYIGGQVADHETAVQLFE